MTQFPAPPVRTDFPDRGNKATFARGWMQWFQAITNRFNAAPPAITGSRGGNAALTSLLAQLAQAGVVTDNTTP